MLEHWQEQKKACQSWAHQAIKWEMISAANAVNDIPGEEGKHLKGYNIEAQNYDVIRKWYKMRGQ